MHKIVKNVLKKSSKNAKTNIFENSLDSSKSFVSFLKKYSKVRHKC